MFTPSTGPSNSLVTDLSPGTFGVKFRSDASGWISAIRFFKGAGNNGTHIGLLYSSAGLELARATFSGETAFGWQTVTFNPPVAIAANTTYVAAVFTDSGYAVDLDYFTVHGVDAPPLHALASGVDGPNGVFTSGAIPQFPASSNRNSNYWVDAALVTSLPGPVLSISKTHSTTFTQGQSGLTYSIVVSNGGAATTNGVVTVTESLPAGLSANSINGANWNCTQPAGPCSRSDTLSPGSSYPPITITVSVAANATSPQVNSVAVSGGGAPNATGTDSTTILAPGSGLRFVPIAPCRVVDTRKSGAFGPAAVIQGGTSRDFVIPAGPCGVPVSAQAYSLNVAVVPTGPLGFLTLWPTGQTQPVASTLNSVDGRTKSNAGIVPAGVNGAVSVFASNATDVILDVNGYFVAASDPTALAFYPVTPCRVADTRKPAGSLAGPSLVGQESRTLAILASTCNIPSTAQAYSLNLAAVPAGPLGFVTAWPAGQARPATASLNDPAGVVTANAAIVPAGMNGAIEVFASNNTDLVIDVNGYFAPMGSGGLSLYTVTPCRVVDTRKPAGRHR
jgi:uncharacterized repeat protein (TIGR01451 family)